MTLDEILATCEAATAGPWEWDGYSMDQLVEHKDTGVWGVFPGSLTVLCAPRYGEDTGDWEPLRDEDGAFIAMARTELPRLARRLKWLEGWAERTRKMMEEESRYWDFRPLADEYHAGPDAEEGRV